MQILAMIRELRQAGHPAQVILDQIQTRLEEDEREFDRWSDAEEARLEDLMAAYRMTEPSF
jgi:iron uptake system EfeUOB component EfeO/EfeM